VNLQRWWDDFCYELRLEARDFLRMFMESSTWLVILVLAVFGAEIYFGMGIALRYDSLMHLWGVRADHYCRVLSNGQYLTLIYLLFAFGVTMVYGMGCLVNYITARKQRRAPEEIRRRAWIALVCVLAAESLGGVAMLLLVRWC
jgi:Na+-driven multidrug efflux pump